MLLAFIASEFRYHIGWDLLIILEVFVPNISYRMTGFIEASANVELQPGLCVE